MSTTASGPAATADHRVVSHDQPPTHENFARAVFITLAFVWAAIIAGLAIWFF